MRRANRGVNNLSQPRGLQHPATARKLRGSPEETGNQARQERNGLPRFSCTARPRTPSRTVGRVAQAHGRSAVCCGACGGGFRSRLLATAPRSCPTGKFPRPDSYGAATVSGRARIQPSRCGAPGEMNLQARGRPPTCPAPVRQPAGPERSACPTKPGRLADASGVARGSLVRFVPIRLLARAALCAHGPRSNFGDTRTRCLLVVVVSDRSQSVSGSNNVDSFRLFAHAESVRPICGRAQSPAAQKRG